MLITLAMNGLLCPSHKRCTEDAIAFVIRSDFDRMLPLIPLIHVLFLSLFPLPLPLSLR